MSILYRCFTTLKDKSRGVLQLLHHFSFTAQINLHSCLWIASFIYSNLLSKLMSQIFILCRTNTRWYHGWQPLCPAHCQVWWNDWHQRCELPPADYTHTETHVKLNTRAYYCHRWCKCTFCAPPGFRFPVLYSEEHHLYLYNREDPRCTLSDASGPFSLPCPVKTHSVTLTHTQSYKKQKKTESVIVLSRKGHLWCDGPWYLGKEAEHSLRESLMWNIMLQKQHLLLCFLLSCASQTADKVTLTHTHTNFEPNKQICCFCYKILKTLFFLIKQKNTFLATVWEKTYIWVSGVFGPAIYGHHDSLACKCRSLSCFNANAWNATVCWGEKMAGGLDWTREKRRRQGLSYTTVIGEGCILFSALDFQKKRSMQLFSYLFDLGDIQHAAEWPPIPFDDSHNFTCWFPGCLYCW